MECVGKRIDYRSFSSDVTAAILVYQNNEMAAILVYGTGISSFLFTYFVLFHHPTGATDHVSENDLLSVESSTFHVSVSDVILILDFRKENCLIYVRVVWFIQIIS